MPTTDMQQQLAYFIEHQDELVRLYNGKVLVIKELEVVGVYDTALQAYLEAKRLHPLGTFMIQPCQPGPEAYTVTITTRGLFGDA